MRIFVFNVESFQIFLPVFGKIGNKIDVIWQFLFTYWQSGDFFLGLKDFVLKFVKFQVGGFFFVVWEMEPELAFGWDIWSNISTAGTIVLIDEFHKGLISLLVHDKILFHLLFDFVEDDIFGEDKVFRFHVFVYLVDITFLAFISDGHAVC